MDWKPLFSKNTQKSFKDNPKEIFEIIKKLSSKNSTTILDEKLNQKNLLLIIKDNKLKEKNIISDSTIQKIENWDWYKNLRLKDLSILLIYSIPVLWLISLSNFSKWLLTDIKWATWIDSTEQLKGELNSISERFVSKKTLEFFVKKWLNFWWNKLLKLNLAEFKEDEDLKLKNFSEEDKTIILSNLKELIEFKNNILPTLINNTLNIEWLWFSDNEKNELLKWVNTNLNYKKIIELYIIIWWISSIDINNIKEESLDNWMIFLWLKSILDAKNTASEYWKLKWAIIKKYVNNLSSKSEKWTTSIILDKIINWIVNNMFSKASESIEVAQQVAKWHEFELAWWLSVIALFYFKRAKLIWWAALLWALYLFSSWAIDRFKDTDIYNDIKNLLTDNWEITIEESINKLNNSIQNNIF